MAHKKRIRKMPALMLVLGFSLSGCTTFQASDLQMGVLTNGQKYEKVADFKEKEWTNKFLGWGVNGGTLFNLSANATDPEVRDAIQKNIKKYEGDAAINVKIRYGSNPIQWLLTGITIGIWMPGTVTITGTIIKMVD